jgi:hypothetical protein
VALFERTFLIFNLIFPILISVSNTSFLGQNVSIQKNVIKVSCVSLSFLKRFLAAVAWRQSNKTFYGRNLEIFVIS